MKKIALTGNIASGKSEVEKILINNGFKVIDLDKITHELYKDEIIKNKIFKEFNTLERKKIANIIFDNEIKKERLEKIIHPELKKNILDFFKKNNSENMIFISGALIIQAGFNNLFDKIIYIDSSEDIRLKRLMKRNNLTIQEAQKRIDSQKNEKEKADFIIENNGSKEALQEKIETLLLMLHKAFC